MDCRLASEDGETVTTTTSVNTEFTVDTAVTTTMETGVTEAAVGVEETSDPTNSHSIDGCVRWDSMGSGDATSRSPPVCIPTITMEDIQDLILPGMEHLPSLVRVGELSSCDTSELRTVPQAMKHECNGLPARLEIQEKDDWNILLSPKDIYHMQTFFSGTPAEDESEIKFDLTKLDMLFRCEACQNMPMSSETVHTCDFGHQVCGYCFKNGIRTCLVCKGHLNDNNVPLENVLRRLRENYPHMFDQFTVPVGVGDDINYLSRFYSLKPLVCPQHGCQFRTSARGLLLHFKYEHRQIPKIKVPLFEPVTLLVPKMPLEITNGMVISVVNVSITEKNIASRLATDIMPCWVQCGAIRVGKDKGLALWVSCVYEEEIMPPILFSLRAPTLHGHSSFAGQMTPLHSYTDPQSVLASGRCLLLFPKDISNVRAANKGLLVIELKFYLI